VWEFHRQSAKRSDNLGALETQMYAQVSDAVRKELAELIAAGRIEFTEHGEGWIELIPAAPGAASISMTVTGDAVSFGAGDAGGWFEVFHDEDGQWIARLLELIRCVGDGHYRERVKRGLISSVKVRMEFGAIADSKGRTFVVRYSSLPEPDEPVSEGDRTYDAW
jgi:hypothetical protein